MLAAVISAMSCTNIKFSSSEVQEKTEKIIKLLRANEFKAIDHEFDLLLGKKIYSDSGYLVLNTIYENISTEQGIKTHLDGWCSQTDPSSYAFTMRGFFLVESAWQIRGTGFAYTVKKKDHNAFKEMLVLAQKDFETAYRINPNDPCTASEYITVCTGLSLPEETMNKWFERATSVDPCFYTPYWKKLNFLLPKWHGTWEKASGFADYWYKNAPRGSAAYLLKSTLIIQEAAAFTWRIVDEEESIAATRYFLEKKGYLKELEGIYQRYIDDFPKSCTARLNFASLYRSIGDYRRALPYCDQAISIDPERLDVYSERGHIYYMLKNYDEALQEYYTVLESSPDNEEALFFIGSIELDRNRLEESLQAFNKLIQINPKHEVAFLRRAIAHTYMGNTRSAIADNLQAISLDPKYVAAYNNLSHNYMAVQKIDEAIEVLNRSIGINPTAEAFLSRGQAYDRNKDYDRAIADFTTSLALNPGVNTSVNARLYRAYSLSSKGLHMEAIQDLSAAIKISPTNDFLYFQRGMRWKDMKNYQKARDDLKEALRLNPNSENYQKHLRWIEKIISAGNGEPEA
jgi:tetratricopeptide (TPR) repeat protein